MQDYITSGSTEIVSRVILNRVQQFTSMGYVDHLFDSKPATLPYHIIGIQPSSGKSVVARDIMLSHSLSERIYSPIILREGVILYGAERVSSQNIVIVDNRTMHKWRYLLSNENCCYIYTQQQLNILIRRDYSGYKYLIIMAPALMPLYNNQLSANNEYRRFIDTLFAYCVIDIDKYINFPLILAQVYFVLVDTIRYINNITKPKSAAIIGEDRSFTFNNCILPNINIGNIEQSIHCYRYNICTNIVSVNSIYINLYSNTIKYLPTSYNTPIAALTNTSTEVLTNTSTAVLTNTSTEVLTNTSIEVLTNTSTEVLNDLSNISVLVNNTPILSTECINNKSIKIYHSIRYSATPYNIKSISIYGRRLSINLHTYNNIDISLLKLLHLTVIKNYLLMGRIAGYNRYSTLANITDIHHCYICNVSKPRAYFLTCCFNTLCADCFAELIYRSSHICPYCRYTITDSAVALNIYSLENIATVSNINLLYSALIKTKLLGAGNIKSSLMRYVNVKLLDSSDGNSVIHKEITRRSIPEYHIYIPPRLSVEDNNNINNKVDTYLDTQLIQDKLLAYLRLNNILLSSRVITTAINGGDMYNPGTVLIVHNHINEAKFLLKYINIPWADFSKIYKSGDTYLNKFCEFLSGKVPLLVINMEEIIAEYPNPSNIDIYDTFCKHGSTAGFYNLLSRLSAATTRIINFNMIYIKSRTRWQYYDQLMRLLINKHNNSYKLIDPIEIVNISIV